MKIDEMPTKYDDALVTGKNTGGNPGLPGPVGETPQTRIVQPDGVAGRTGERVPPCGKVLLVDDEPINRRVVVAILQKIGLETDVAPTGIEAVRMVESTDYSLVLMDIHMPEMNGFETTSTIRAWERQTNRRPVTIIAMTANDGEATRHQCLAAGMDDFLTKPIDPEVLTGRIVPWLSKNKEKGPAPDVPGKSGQKGEEPVHELWSRKGALRYVGGDEPLLGKLAHVFLGRNDLLLDHIAAAIDHGDAAALQDAAHAYKGAVGHFACPVLWESAVALEKQAKEGRLDGAAGHLVRLRDNSRLLCSDLRRWVIDCQSG